MGKIDSNSETNLILGQKHSERWHHARTPIYMTPGMYERITV